MPPTPRDTAAKSWSTSKPALILASISALRSVATIFSTVAVGGDNIFDTYPGKEQDGVFQFLGVVHSVTSPFGFNGAMWYVRGSVYF
jgi:hypothetical protein